jgi:hypothetical protein
MFTAKKIFRAVKSLRDDGSLYFGQLRPTWLKQPTSIRNPAAGGSAADQNSQEFTFNYRVI